MKAFCRMEIYNFEYKGEYDVINLKVNVSKSQTQKSTQYSVWWGQLFNLCPTGVRDSGDFGIKIQALSTCHFCTIYTFLLFSYYSLVFPYSLIKILILKSTS